MGARFYWERLLTIGGKIISHMNGCRRGPKKETEVVALCVPLQLPGCLYVCLYVYVPLYVSLCVPLYVRLYVPLCEPLLARATACLLPASASAWESAFTAPHCSTRPRQPCPFLPLQRQYNHQMTQTTIRTVHSVFPPPSSTKPQDPWHRPFNLHSQRK